TRRLFGRELKGRTFKGTALHKKFYALVPEVKPGLEAWKLAQQMRSNYPAGTKITGDPAEQIYGWQIAGEMFLRGEITLPQLNHTLATMRQRKADRKRQRRND